MMTRCSGLHRHLIARGMLGPWGPDFRYHNPCRKASSKQRAQPGCLSVYSCAAGPFPWVHPYEEWQFLDWILWKVRMQRGCGSFRKLEEDTLFSLVLDPNCNFKTEACVGQTSRQVSVDMEQHCRTGWLVCPGATVTMKTSQAAVRELLGR